jgi:hypothetical protein
MSPSEASAHKYVFAWFGIVRRRQAVGIANRQTLAPPTPMFRPFISAADFRIFFAQIVRPLRIVG